jgi:hypothetical protein
VPLGSKIFENFPEKDDKISILQDFIISLMKMLIPAYLPDNGSWLEK